MTDDPLEPLTALPGVADAVEISRTAVDALLNHRVLRRRSSDVSAESLLRGAWASARLAGSQASLADVRAGSVTGDPALNGALRISAELATLAETWRLAQRQVLARLHALAAAEFVEESQLGRPRPDREVAHRLDTLADVLDQTKAPAVVVSAIVQGEILSLDAFAPVSGLVARAAARLTLIDRGLDPKSLVVLEVGQLEVDEESQEALEAYGSGDPAGVVRWIALCARAIELGARESLAICEALQRG